MNPLLAEFQRIVPTPLRISEEPDATALGAAILASVGCGEYRTVADAAAEMTHTRPLERNAGLSDEGDSEYADWKKRYPALGKLSV